MKPWSEKNTIWIAVPYYCALLTPQQGLSRIYFFAQIDRKSRRVCHQLMKIWQGEQSGSLAVWLRKQGAAGVLSTDSAPFYAQELRSEGLWLWQAPASDIDELIKVWLADPDLLAEPDRM
jgi:hypothetical protein